MRVQIRVLVGEGYYGSGPSGEKDVVLESESDLASLPWEAICANLVQSAIKEYEKELAEGESEGE
jgi:hypothetical protein